MPDATRASPFAIGYCTNVHAGATLDDARCALEAFAVPLRRRLPAREPLNLGLWLSAEAARELVRNEGIAPLRDWLGERNLRVFSLNGFPYGDFHDSIVKHRVYEPSWAHRDRLSYTLDLARILAGLIDEGDEAGISTLPLGWNGPPCAPVDVDEAARTLRHAATELARLAERTGRLIHLDLEPEPGCLLTMSADVVTLFDRHFNDPLARRHLRICHDICHAAVMFEDQQDVLRRYAAAGIRIGKIQVSSAPRALMEHRAEAERFEMFAALRALEEPRYLHQTTIRDGDTGGETTFYEDLPIAIDDRADLDRLGDEWRVHFHVPIHLDSIGKLDTTRDEIERCLDQLSRLDDQPVLEVETYAWSVLPAEFRGETLVDDIARELSWLRAELERRNVPPEPPPEQDAR